MRFVTSQKFQVSGVVTDAQSASIFLSNTEVKFTLNGEVVATATSSYSGRYTPPAAMEEMTTISVLYVMYPFLDASTTYVPAGIAAVYLPLYELVAVATTSPFRVNLTSVLDKNMLALCASVTTPLTWNFGWSQTSYIF